MMVTLSARPIRFHPILWSQNTAARCSASSTLRSRSCGLGSIGRPVTRYPATSRTPHIVVATSDVQSHAATAPERAFRADGRQRLAKRAQARDGAIWSAEYWAKKGDVALNLWRKRVGAPKAGEPPLPLLFLVHGSSNSARSSYDLTVPGKGEYSLMNVFARYGYDVWTIDHDGYGYSGSSGNNSDVASGVEDLKAAVPVVARETGRAKMHFYGTPSGSIRPAD